MDGCGFRNNVCQEDRSYVLFHSFTSRQESFNPLNISNKMDNDNKTKQCHKIDNETMS